MQTFGLSYLVITATNICHLLKIYSLSIFALAQVYDAKCYFFVCGSHLLQKICGTTKNENWGARDWPQNNEIGHTKYYMLLPTIVAWPTLKQCKR